MVMLLASAACARATPLDCEVVKEEFYECMDRVVSEDELLLGCIPKGDLEHIEGVWLTDFEFNQFYEGRRAAPADAWKVPEPWVRLWVVDKNFTSEAPSGAAVVRHVSFDGRRELCDVGAPISTIFAERVRSERIVSVEPTKHWDP